MLVAVCTTTLNAEETLGRCADSIIPQLRNGIVWVIVDANSRDGTWPFLRDLAMRNPMVLAASVARLGTITMGEGRRLASWISNADVYIHGVDGDVVYEPDAVDRVLEAFEANGRRPMAGDNYFVIGKEDYWRIEGHLPLNENEDMDTYDRLARAGTPVTRKVLGIQRAHLKWWACDRCAGTGREPVEGRTSTRNPEECTACKGTAHRRPTVRCWSANG